MVLKQSYFLIIVWLFYLGDMSNAAIDGLGVQVRPLPGLSKNTSASSYAFRVEMIDRVTEVLETLLYSSLGKEKAFDEGRRILKDYQHGTITVVDSKDNLRKVSDYLDQLSASIQEVEGSTYIKPKGRIFNIKHADPNNIRNLLNQILQESKVYSKGGAGTGTSYVTGVIVPGAGNGLTFLDVTVELVDILGQDTINAQARLYIYTSNRDREVTLTRGNSDLLDNFRIRLISVDPRRQEAEIEIRFIGYRIGP